MIKTDRMNILRDLINQVNIPFTVDNEGNTHTLTKDIALMPSQPLEMSKNIKAYVPALDPKTIGEPGLAEKLKIKYPIIAGAMYHGITAEKMVIAMGQAGMMGFYGSGGISPNRVQEALFTIKKQLGDKPFGCNLLHSPAEPALEEAMVDILLGNGIKTISASAYIDLSLSLLKYRYTGIHRDSSGKIVCPNKVLGKISRIETGRRFFSPPTGEKISALIQQGILNQEQANMAALTPVSDIITAEADSGGHTDNRPFITMFPSILALRDRLQGNYPDIPLMVGAAGGLSTPSAMGAAFSMGAAYILTGSVNQSCHEAATSAEVKKMLCQASFTDIMMAPAADMFEMGVKVQVLKSGTMFPMRATKLYEIYKKYDNLDEIPDSIKSELEKNIFRHTFQEIWRETESYFSRIDPTQVERAEKEPRHKMALVFRWYLGKSSNWAIQGESTRRIDYQIQCGPAMGAFNEWAKDSFLEGPQDRDIVTVNMNLLYGAMVQMRMNMLRSQGFILPREMLKIRPRPLDEIYALMGGKA